MRDFGFDPYPQRLHIKIPDARQQLEDGLRYYLGNDFKWLEAYDKVADWLTDNHQRGLLCLGTCGLGKTLICQNIIPVLLSQNMRHITSCYTAIEMNSKIDTLLTKNSVVIDDLGTEYAETNTYGNKRVPFAELCDQAERRGNLLIITSNLTAQHYVHPQTNQVVPSIEDRYGQRTLSRLRAITKVIKFFGEDMRK